MTYFNQSDFSFGQLGKDFSFSKNQIREKGVKELSNLIPLANGSLIARPTIEYVDDLQYSEAYTQENYIGSYFYKYRKRNPLGDDFYNQAGNTNKIELTLMDILIHFYIIDSPNGEGKRLALILKIKDINPQLLKWKDTTQIVLFQNEDHTSPFTVVNPLEIKDDEEKTIKVLEAPNQNLLYFYSKKLFGRVITFSLNAGINADTNDDDLKEPIFQVNYRDNKVLDTLDGQSGFYKKWWKIDSFSSNKLKLSFQDGNKNDFDDLSLRVGLYIYIEGAGYRNGQVYPDSNENKLFKIDNIDDLALTIEVSNLYTNSNIIPQFIEAYCRIYQVSESAIWKNPPRFVADIEIIQNRIAILGHSVEKVENNINNVSFSKTNDIFNFSEDSTPAADSFINIELALKNTENLSGGAFLKELYIWTTDKIFKSDGAAISATDISFSIISLENIKTSFSGVMDNNIILTDSADNLIQLDSSEERQKEIPYSLNYLNTKGIISGAKKIIEVERNLVDCQERLYILNDDGTITVFFKESELQLISFSKISFSFGEVKDIFKDNLNNIYLVFFGSKTDKDIVVAQLKTDSLDINNYVDFLDNDGSFGNSIYNGKRVILIKSDGSYVRSSVVSSGTAPPEYEDGDKYGLEIIQKFIPFLPLIEDNLGFNIGRNTTCQSVILNIKNKESGLLLHNIKDDSIVARADNVIRNIKTISDVDSLFYFQSDITKKLLVEKVYNYTYLVEITTA